MYCRTLLCFMYLHVHYFTWHQLFPILHLSSSAPMLKNCPNNITDIADKGQNFKSVSWTEPSGSDTYSVTHNYKPGDTFYIGSTEVTYVFWSSDGLVDRCTFFITISQIKCQQIKHRNVPNLLMLCTHYDERYGAKCYFECQPGFSLVGSSLVTCTKDGQWTHSVPVCKVSICPSLKPTPNYKCTNGFNKGSQCHRVCPMGYEMHPYRPRVVLCEGRRWSGDLPECIDVTNPQIQRCIPFFDAVADRNSTYGIMKWFKPKVTDNSHETVKLTQNVGLYSGIRVSVGSYEVIYTAKDKAGNKAQPCKITLQMKVLSCPPLFNNNYMSVTCSSGNRYGAQCTFSCKTGSELVGQNVTTCEISKNGHYADWDFGAGQAPYCKVHRRCADYPIPPGHGSVVCDTWSDGKICFVMCQKGFYFKPDYPIHDMLVCGNDGTWGPKSALPIPDCSKRPAVFGVDAVNFKLYSKYYMEGNCLDPSVKKSIKSKYVGSLLKSKFGDQCYQRKSKCQLGGVKIICGASMKKRSAEMTIVADFLIDSEEFQTEEDFEDIQSNIFGVLQNETVDGMLDIVFDDNVRLTAFDMSVDRVAFQCPNNTIPSYQTSSCVECPRGTHYNISLQTCLQCSKGYYQPFEGQPHCIRCPEETTTAQIGSKFVEECLGNFMKLCVFVRSISKLGEGAVKVQKKDCQPDAFTFHKDNAVSITLCTINRLDDNGVPLS